MASLKTRKRRDGGISYQVQWVMGGGKPGPGTVWGSETFTKLPAAKSFKADVEAAGHQWPEGWTRGWGYGTQQEQTTGPTLDEVAEKYFEHTMRRAAKNLIQGDSVYKYRRIYALHIRGTFGTTPFTAIRRANIEDWIEYLSDNGASPKSVHNWHSVLSSIMKLGSERLELRPDVPTRGLDLPKADARDKRQVRFFDHGEWDLFRSHLRSDVHLLVDVLIETGMRWGEITALCKGHLKRKPNGDLVINIEQAWHDRAPDDESPIYPERFENNSWKLGPPKNGRSRKVVLSDEVAKRLWERAEELGDDDAYLFQREGDRSTGCPWRYPDFHYERWAPARDAVEALGATKRFTPHMLRHTTVVWSLAGGVPLEEISERLGHASIQITYDRYGGMVDPEDNRMAKAMARQRKLKRPVPTDHVIRERDDMPETG